MCELYLSGQFKTELMNKIWNKMKEIIPDEDLHVEISRVDEDSRLGEISVVINTMRTIESEHWKGGKYIYTHYENVAKFQLNELPGFSAVISSGMFVSEKYRGKGIATFLQKIKEEICRSNGIRTIFCTVNSDNEIQKKVLLNNGWTLFGLVEEKTEMWKKSIKEN